MAEIVEIVLNIALLFLLTIGLFFVSAGAFLSINKTPITHINILIYIVNSIYLHIIGQPINISVELSKHIQLFVACNPNPVVLKTLKHIIKITTSFNIPNKSDNVKIIIIFENVKYILTIPYSISLSFVSL
jgi:hypothetical protein